VETPENPEALAKIALAVKLVAVRSLIPLRLALK
jgi:hypothetical protein